MRLTKFTDYALRVLLLAAGRRAGGRLTIDEVAATFDISRGHVKKVVLHLSRAGFLTGTRGRSGGVALARPPAEINIGAVIRATEPDFGLFECYLPGNACRVTRGCRLASVGNRALSRVHGGVRRRYLGGRDARRRSSGRCRAGHRGAAPPGAAPVAGSSCRTSRAIRGCAGVSSKSRERLEAG